MMADTSKLPISRVDELIDKLNEINNNFNIINNKLDSMKYVIESGSNENNTQWYRKWNDGFIEQWGNIIFSQSAGSYTNQTTTLPIAFSSTAYYITLIATNSNNQQSHTCGILVKNKNSFNWSSSYWWARDAYVSSFNWYACGY